MSEYLTSMTFDYDEILRELKDCDIVEFNRLKYSHFALHIANGVFVHVTGNEGENKGGSKGTKCAQHLRSIAKNDPCRINNLEFAKAFQEVGAGDFGRLKTRSVADTKRLALTGLRLDINGHPLLGTDNGITVTYDLLGWNCERYCTYWKYDCDGFSQQAYNGVVSTTIGNAQRLCDGAAAGYFRAVESDEVPFVAKPFCAAAGCVMKGAAITVGTGKAVVDGATSLLYGIGNGVMNLFE
ncbi:uncharacterized protein LOC119079208 [Bradysia coprophila]|uniref:uncharacterized protein LOC119078363 n=1 Tax=Bradysia coprophila TaxID=38358 RepID=UPI00187D9DDC|nr:uncharacterized protein LOC119078363 [Bradysia coprophila]XP_037041762.1 uncharacterized protein LOC119078363 [Bradysia coprophila]XP_037041763.1 uncharacterized protein LOC119078363 [Bradysia coprophila]XP_037041764.1 uncharacterized protein LOC119078365 [Bradysia coprophila]XP_037041765.1 uncharacterized protein LOC119078365 [Bradysia coprophila]XP_037041766.1 uncharacterized protein LOC119078365 [Bradysia coprophila]XP_037042890.1 uncharacterized protein LOC119079208 [Bradysia coprophil